MSDENKTRDESPPLIGEFIRKDIEESVKKRQPEKPIPFLEWMEMAQKDPSLTQLSHERVFGVINSGGYERIDSETDPRRARLLGLNQGFTLRVPNFLKNFYGIEWTLSDLDTFLYSAAGQGEASRQMLFMYGPPGGGKSTMLTHIRRLLENFGFWQLVGCEHHDNPVNLIPRHLRSDLQEKFGIYIDPSADICSQCRQKLIDEYGTDYSRFEVEWKKISQRGSCGIAVVSEVDPINFNMALLIGEEDISMLGKYKRGDPKTLRMNGASSRGNRGWLEEVEVFKNPIEALRPLITLLQERYVPLPKFVGQVYVDTMVVGHSNEEEWRRFQDDASNEAIMDRILIVRAPYNLRLTEEVKIYRESFLGKSKKFRNIHIDPHALEHVARFILFTRLAPSDKCDIMTKINIYDTGETVKNVSFDELQEEAYGKEGEEGMVGLSYRTALKNIIERSIALNRFRWEDADPNDKRATYLKSCGGYLNPLWVHAEIIRYIRRLNVGRDAEWPRPSRQRWLEFAQSDLYRELMRVIEADILQAASVALGISSTARAEELFRLYISNAVNFKLSANYDLGFLRSVEEHLDISTGGMEAFRIETAKTAMELGLRGEQYRLESNEVLQRALNRKLRQPVLSDVLAALGKRPERKKTIEEMVKMGYAEMGSWHIIKYALEHLGRN